MIRVLLTYFLISLLSLSTQAQKDEMNTQTSLDFSSIDNYGRNISGKAGTFVGSGPAVGSSNDQTILAIQGSESHWIPSRQKTTSRINHFMNFSQTSAFGNPGVTSLSTMNMARQALIDQRWSSVFRYSLLFFSLLLNIYLILKLVTSGKIKI